MSYPCPKCGNTILTSQDNFDWSIPDDSFPPDKCDKCKYETNEMEAMYKDNLINGVAFIVYLVFIGFLFIWALSS